MSKDKFKVTIKYSSGRRPEVISGVTEDEAKEIELAEWKNPDVAHINVKRER